MSIYCVARELLKCSADRATRDLDVARHFFRSARAVVGHTPDRVTTDEHDAYPRAIRGTLSGKIDPGGTGKMVFPGSQASMLQRYRLPSAWNQGIVHVAGKFRPSAQARK